MANIRDAIREYLSVVDEELRGAVRIAREGKHIVMTNAGLTVEEFKKLL